MQRPTLQNVRIRSTADALAVFYGVARNVLPLITRRLDIEERRAIVPGNIYVWEERGSNTEYSGVGMERWTDGMGWGPSRVRDEFLFYHQKEAEVGEDPGASSTPWAQMIRWPKKDDTLDISNKPAHVHICSVYPASHACAMAEAERLIKQTYSVYVSLPMERSQGIVRKWHLTAYFSQRKLDSLATLDVVAGVGDVAVPEEWFKSARAGKAKRDNRDGKAHTPFATAECPGSSLGTFSSSQVVFAHNRHSSGSSVPPLSLSPSPYGHSYCSSSTSTNRGHVPVAVGGQLVPLQYLQTMLYPRRDPTDEQLLMRFSLSRSETLP